MPGFGADVGEAGHGSLHPERHLVSGDARGNLGVVDPSGGVLVERVDRIHQLRLVGPSPLSPGGTATFAFTVTNNGPSNALSTYAALDLPPFGAITADMLEALGPAVEPGDIDVAQLYDINSFEVLRQLEVLGFCAPGEAAGFVAACLRSATATRPKSSEVAPVSCM
mgnify:CR=1 FL=1